MAHIDEAFAIMVEIVNARIDRFDIIRFDQKSVLPGYDKLVNSTYR